MKEICLDIQISKVMVLVLVAMPGLGHDKKKHYLFTRCGFPRKFTSGFIFTSFRYYSNALRTNDYKLELNEYIYFFKKSFYYF
jgi:hypothetical protein